MRPAWKVDPGRLAPEPPDRRRSPCFRTWPTEENEAARSFRLPTRVGRPLGRGGRRRARCRPARARTVPVTTRTAGLGGLSQRAAQRCSAMCSASRCVRAPVDSRLSKRSTHALPDTVVSRDASRAALLCPRLAWIGELLRHAAAVVLPSDHLATSFGNPLTRLPRAARGAQSCAGPSRPIARYRTTALCGPSDDYRRPPRGLA